MGWFDKGAKDQSAGKGQMDPNKFKNDQARKDYQAGHNAQKQKEQEKKK